MPIILANTRQAMDNKLSQWFDSEMPGLFIQELINEALRQGLLVLIDDENYDSSMAGADNAPVEAVEVPF